MTNLAQDKLQMLCDKYQPAMKYGKLRWQITNGKVAPALATTATRELASMIIIGTNGASGFEKYWMGSQAVRIVQDSPCPVLTVRQGYNFHKKLERTQEGRHRHGNEGTYRYHAQRYYFSAIVLYLRKEYEKK